MTQSAPQIVNPDPQFQSRDTPLQLDRRIGLYTGIAAGLIGLMFLSQGITQPVIQLFIIAAVFMLTALINIFSLETVNFKDPRVGVYVGLGALQLSLIIFALLFTNTSLIAASLIIITGVFVISGQLRGRDVDWGVVITLVAAMISGLAGIITAIPQYNLSNLSFQLRLFLIIIAAAYVIFLGVLTLRNLTSTITVKLITSSLAITLIPLLLLSTIQTDFIRNIVQNQTNQALKLAGEETANRIDDFFSANLDQVERAASLSAFINYLNLDPMVREGSSQEQQLALTIGSLKAQEQAYLTSIGLLDLQGRNVYDSNPALTGGSEDTGEYFVQPLRTGQIFVSSVLFSDQNGDAYLYFSAPVRNSSGQLMGVLRLRYDALILQEELGASVNLLGARTYPMLIDELNIRIADLARPSEIYKAIAPLTADQIASIQAQKRLPDLPPEQLYTNLPDFATSLEQAGANPYFNTYLYESGTAARGMSAVAIRLKNKPWNVVFLQERTALINLLQERNRTSSLIAILLAGAVGLITVLFARIFSRPILSLRETAANIAAGDMNAQATVTTRDEIGALGQTFNLMTQQLRGFIGELEDRVNERTVELARQNDSLQLRSQQLQTVSDVARQIVSARELETLLNQVAILISERFNFYHVGIFLLDQNSEFALLRAANSAGGQRMLARGHKLR
ncbi:MAG TPA: cache domain-containing protein, partial [Anaerolineaceae bacterium]|nr:cache domain-containing protein [Anaerolineaceae bacterium]